ncbi:MAG: glutamate--tRNA ligase [Pirellulales bacterium]
MTVRTRFAPSPTGYLHIGGVRTALFCWLFARARGGQFILRIDDTDQERNVEAALAPILEGLRWLGIDWDEGPGVGGPHAPYYQSQRLDRYQAAVEKLLTSGHAYRDYATTEEIQAERDIAAAQKGSFRYSRRWMAETPADCARFEAEGRKAVVRLKMPHEGKLVINDIIRGQVEFDWGREQDHVVQRADGSCLYHLANVVDDQDFEITHVIRAEEHLSNTPRQIFIAQALGYPLPEYAHLPFVAEPGSRNKLSKRKLDKYLKNRDFAQVFEHGQEVARRLGLDKPSQEFNPVVTDFYRLVGYLPEAITNYLALLGWSLDDKTEFFTRSELIAAFSLERVNKGPASFDSKKLMAFQDHYMQQVPTAKKVDQTLPYLMAAGLVSEPVGEDDRTKVARLVEAAGDRIKVFGDILDYADFFLADDQVPCDEKAFQKWILKPGAPTLLAKVKDRLAAAESFDVPALENLLRAFVEAEGIKLPEIVHALRVALTGKTVGFGLFDSLAILGRERSVARIDRALRRI